ncbi:MAG TPA: ATP-binding protein [Burkholderiales bacterium]|nr:ATP-binding protein [Burkholderiales bacterium]
MDSPDRRRFNASEAEFPVLCEFVEERCAALRNDERQRVLLLVEELFTNSINHGYGGDSNDPVWLTLTLTDTACQIVFEDCAPAHNPFDTPDLELDEMKLDDRRIGGLGIVLLSEFSFERGYERQDDRNVIKLQVRRAFGKRLERAERASKGSPAGGKSPQ